MNSQQHVNCPYQKERVNSEKLKAAFGKYHNKNKRVDEIEGIVSLSEANFKYPTLACFRELIVSLYLVFVSEKTQTNM